MCGSFGVDQFFGVFFLVVRCSLWVVRMWWWCDILRLISVFSMMENLFRQNYINSVIIVLIELQIWLQLLKLFRQIEKLQDVFVQVSVVNSVFQVKIEVWGVFIFGLYLYRMLMMIIMIRKIVSYGIEFSSQLCSGILGRKLKVMGMMMMIVSFRMIMFMMISVSVQVSRNFIIVECDRILQVVFSLWISVFIFVWVEIVVIRKEIVVVQFSCVCFVVISELICLQMMFVVFEGMNLLVVWMYCLIRCGLYYRFYSVNSVVSLGKVVNIVQKDMFVVIRFMWILFICLNRVMRNCYIFLIMLFVFVLLLLDCS